MRSGSSTGLNGWHDMIRALAAPINGHWTLFLIGVICSVVFTGMLVIGGTDGSLGIAGLGAIGLIGSPVLASLLASGGTGAFVDGWIAGFWGFWILAVIGIYLVLVLR